MKTLNAAHPVFLGEQRVGGAMKIQSLVYCFFAICVLQLPGLSGDLLGEYINEPYHYRVRIPSNLQAKGPVCDAAGICGSTHGFRGHERREPGILLDLWAEYVFPDEEAAGPAVDAQVLRGFKWAATSKRSVLIVDRFQATKIVLGDGRNERGATVVYFLGAGKTIRFQITAEYPMETQEAAGRLLDSVLRSFRWVE